MTTPTTYCSGRVALDSWTSRPCGRKAVTTYEGHAYCKVHNPELRKERRNKRRVGVCNYREPYRSRCGHPAIGVDKYGWGRCADHTEERLAHLERLNEAAPELLEAIRFTLSVMQKNHLDVELSEQMAIEKLKQAIAQVETRS